MEARGARGGEEAEQVPTTAEVVVGESGGDSGGRGGGGRRVLAPEDVCLDGVEARGVEGLENRWPFGRVDARVVDGAYEEEDAVAADYKRRAVVGDSVAGGRHRGVVERWHGRAE